MSNERKQLSRAKRRGGINAPVDKSHGLKNPGRGGNIQTNWADINWTKKNVIFVSLLLGTPYLMAIIASWIAGARVITYILLGLAVLCGLIAWFLRSLEDEF
ncbi:MAG: hypothetical protein QNJ70_23450 [Xenococcaceae cyanobacterium MO_207.B15]|nr:hypothetical protein [Xenococcaceae cyanobacterium MO_207.B15]MDJ0743880.1 hypothetical protein [Xenococcaceae cyanobacterium MO_167.B27]